MKILVISSNLIGDTILSTGVIEHFYNINQKSKFTFLIGPTAAQIYENFPGMERVIVIKKKKYNLHWIDMYLFSRKINWDVVIDLRSSILSYLIKSNKKYIFKKNIKIHHIEQLNKSLKINANKLKIYTSKDEEAEVENKLDKNYKYVIIFPGGNWNPKIWPADNYNKLLRIMFETFHNIKYIVVGSNLERKKYLKNIQANLPKDNFIDIMGASLTLTSAYMKRSNLFIGNDSGLTHLSVASNLKTIALFGPTNDINYGHRKKDCFILRTKEDYDFFNKVNIDENKSYMLSITPNHILDIITKNKLL